MASGDFLKDLLERAREELARRRPGLERTGRVYRTFLVMASDEWWGFVTTRWTWDAGLLFAGILFGALLGGVPGALVGIVFVLMGSFFVTLVRAPVRAIDYVNFKRKEAVRDVEERSGIAPGGAREESSAPGDAPARAPAPAPAPARKTDSRLDVAMQTLVLAPSGPPPASAAGAPEEGRAELVRAMLADGLHERSVLVARRTAGPEAAREAKAALGKWLSKYLTLLQRTLAAADKRDRLQRLLSLAGDDLEKQAHVDAAVLEREVRGLEEADVRPDFEPRTWVWKDWSVL